jgi:hypothetical protein
MNRQKTSSVARRGVIHQCYLGSPANSVKSMITAIAAMLQQTGTPSKIFANDASAFPAIDGLDTVSSTMP